MDETLTDEEIDALEQWARGGSGVSDQQARALTLRAVPEIRRYREIDQRLSALEIWRRGIDEERAADAARIQSMI